MNDGIVPTSLWIGITMPLQHSQTTVNLFSRNVASTSMNLSAATALHCSTSSFEERAHLSPSMSPWTSIKLWEVLGLDSNSSPETNKYSFSRNSVWKLATELRRSMSESVLVLVSFGFSDRLVNSFRLAYIGRYRAEPGYRIHWPRGYEVSCVWCTRTFGILGFVTVVYRMFVTFICRNSSLINVS